MCLLQVITFFLYFHSFTSTVFVRHSVMAINLVKKCFEALLKMWGDQSVRNDSLEN